MVFVTSQAKRDRWHFASLKNIAERFAGLIAGKPAMIVSTENQR